jgi:hypothetical protein
MKSGKRYIETSKFRSAYEIKEERLFIINRPTQIKDYEFKNEKKETQNNNQ